MFYHSLLLPSLIAVSKIWIISLVTADYLYSGVVQFVRCDEGFTTTDDLLTPSQPICRLLGLYLPRRYMRSRGAYESGGPPA